MQEYYRGKWETLKKVRIRPEAAEVLNRDSKDKPGFFRYVPEEQETKNEVGIDEMNVAQLKKYAKDNEIDLGEATKKAEILKAIADSTEVTE